MLSNAPFLSILIVNWNGLSHLDECLTSIFNQGFEDLEVVLVDNGSTDNSLAFLKSHFPEVRVIHSEKNLGFAGGNNFGLPHCRGKYVFFLNNDTRLAPDSLSILRREIKAHPAYDVFACFLISYQDPSLVDSAGDTIYTSACGFTWAGYPVTMFTKPREVTSACAGAAVYTRSLVEKLGGFDEDFFLIFEDMDLSFRARHLGASILFLPDVKVFHKGSASMGGKSSYTSIFFTDRNYLSFFIKNYPTSILLKSIPGILVMKFMRLVVAARNRRLGAWARANIIAISLIPKMMRKRSIIQANSKLTTVQFEKLLRKNWWSERQAFKRGDFNIPV